MKTMELWSKPSLHKRTFKIRAKMSRLSNQKDISPKIEANKHLGWPVLHKTIVDTLVYKIKLSSPTMRKIGGLKDGSSLSSI